MCCLLSFINNHGIASRFTNSKLMSSTVEAVVLGIDHFKTHRLSFNPYLNTAVLPGVLNLHKKLFVLIFITGIYFPRVLYWIEETHRNTYAVKLLMIPLVHTMVYYESSSDYIIAASPTQTESNNTPDDGSTFWVRCVLRAGAGVASEART
jgi:hypothetical protein